MLPSLTVCIFQEKCRYHCPTHKRRASEFAEDDRGCSVRYHRYPEGYCGIWCSDSCSHSVLKSLLATVSGYALVLFN